MSKVNVRTYTDRELLDRVSSLASFKGIPAGYWILGVRSNEDESNTYDDKGYLFQGTRCLAVFPMTTNPGREGLINFEKYNSQGCAVVKADEWYYGLWRYGLHKGRMPALKQIRDILYYRDNNKNSKSEEIGKVYKGIIGINFHTNTYDFSPSAFKKIINWLIGGWSVGCQVVNNLSLYNKVLSLVKNQDSIAYCLINEF